MKKLPKVLMLINELEIGGAQKHVIALTLELSRRGYEVDICTIYNREVFGGQKIEWNGRYFTLGAKGKIDLEAVRRLVNLIKDNNYDIIHSHLFVADIYNYLTSFFLDRRRVRISTEHSSSSRRKSFKIFGYLYYLTSKSFDDIIAVSEHVRHHLVDWAGIDASLINVVYNGVQIQGADDYIVPMKEQKEFTLGIIARLEARKDVTTSLKAMNVLVNNLGFKQARLMILGDGPQRQSLENLTKELNLENHVEFLGFIENIGPYIKKMDVHLLTSLEEAFGISIIECMAYGVPSICTRAGGIPEIIDEGKDGFLVQKGDFKAVADKAALLINDRSMLHKMGLQAKNKYLGLFSSEAMGDTVEKIYLKNFL